MQLHSVTRRIATAALLFSALLPTITQAAEIAAQTRGAFIVDVVNAFNISTQHTGTLPYKRVPSIQRPYIQAAYDKGGLAIFGDDLQPGRAITRGEAAQVIAALSGQVPAATEKRMTDVPKGSALATAVTVVVEKEWMKPHRRNRFGANEPLSASESRLIMKRIERWMQEPAKKDALRARPKATDPVEVERHKILDSVWDLLQKQYLYEDRIDGKKANYSAAEALVKTLNDPYTVFLPPAESRQFQQQLSGEIIGIGVEVEAHPDGLLIVAPLAGSPAEKGGIKARDVITAVDGVSLQGVPYPEAVMKVRGTKGTSAIIRIRRDGADLDFKITRDTVKVPEITLTMKGSAAIIKVSQFGEITEREIRGIFTKAKEKNPTGIIIDLRNNPGGLLHAADVLMSGFVPHETLIANIHTRDGVYKEQSDGTPIFAADMPVMVLVNKGSASASEIVAGAFQDLKRATIIGETTFGKGTVQQIAEFNDGSSLKMTIAEWKTPKDRKIDGVGVTPDIVVDSAADPEAALNRAIDLLY